MNLNKKFKCSYCSDELPVTMVQQGGMHLYCFEEWFHEEIVIFQIKHDESCFMDDSLSFLLDMLNNSEVDDTFTITKFKMKRGDYNALPEFKGF